MEPFETLHAKAVPLLVDDVDTDVITPIGRVLQGGSALVEFAFEPLRYDAAGRLHGECPLDDPRYAGAQILIAGANFACGSSRETAVWAVRGLGFRCVIAPSFGDIFHSNCFKNGVLPVRLAAGDVAALAAFAEGGAGLVTVDLEAQQVRAGERRYGFDVPPLRKEALRSGLDDLGLILRRRDEISRFEQADRVARPWAHLEGD
ncbi:MAG: 3-isopropylmalate dehydratase small subunit [Deltaproteobacteria bacterium]|nr:3-isopropylmalate dehydratase small subunit [Deltaproteobacteria bacterium]